MTKLHEYSKTVSSANIMAEVWSVKSTKAVLVYNTLILTGSLLILSPSICDYYNEMKWSPFSI